MDLSQPQPNLSLGFLTHTSPPHRTQIADDSISLQLESSFRDPNHPVPTVPLQLLEPMTGNHYELPENGNLDGQNDNKDNDDGDGEEDRDVEEFRILGHSMCLKRRRGSEPPQSSSKRGMVAPPDLEARNAMVRSWMNPPLSVADPVVFEIMEKEKKRQFRGIELIASENFVCRAVMEALGSHLTNKYSEGMPGARYYGGNQYIDEIETLCCERALAAFGLDSENWGVNVQPYSCTSANFAVYTGLLLPGDRIMGLDTPSGGNTSHGYYLPNGRKVSGASIFFESFSYKVNPHSGYVDFDKLEERAMDFRPKILICGGSSYPREWDYARFRQIADKCGAVLMCDMAQISGLVAAKECLNPFEYCDIVTSTTHKSLRGPRGGIIFFRKGLKPRKRGMLLSQGDGSDQYDFEEKINFAVFPSLQGGPHNNHTAALAIALKHVATPEYKTYMQQVKKNAQALASALLRRKCRLVTGGTDNHLLLWDLRPLGLTGKTYEKICEMCHITLNKIAIFDDNGTITPGGVRIGTPAMTSRGCLESDFETMADFLLRAAHLASVVQREYGKLQKTCLKDLENNKDVLELRARVETFATQFVMPGFDV
ncbi:Serine hydroxymethyltransferase [Tripterygium wilfordii]|uniref:Serine hydroxymethyltransferase n=1 Tax=Tripterygium wilfordii TaxID=458696 RepID=A0A7J7CHG2_TRIWF|nr:serine hydroxymethyltransferase 6-like [Tripterygium wilfordii]KAF5733500.1 Serine hydroxymethyltransferase [Tripterygium wilfordii]